MNSSDSPSSPSLFGRRALLQGVGAVLAAAAVAPLRSLRAQESGAAPADAPASASAPAAGPSVIKQLSAYMAEAGEHELPADAAEATKFHIIDTLSAMISGVDLPPGAIAKRYARTFGGGGSVATVVGTDLTCGPLEAAIANGLLAHADETDDSHASGRFHPGCGIVTATLAAGEQFGIDGARWIRAVALGYDVGARVTMTLGNEYIMTKNHRDTHQIANTFGCSAAAACTARLNAQQMRWVLDYAAQQAAGITAWQRDTQHIEKAMCFAGFPARNGVTTALVLSAGATGVNDIFTGTDNYFLAYAPKADLHGLIDGLGRRFEVKNTDIKKWTVGSPIQSVLDCLYTLLKERPFKADDVKHVVIRVGTSGAAIVNNREMPDISLQHMAAVMIVDGTVSFNAAHDVERMKDPAVLAVKSRIELVPDAELEKFYPERQGIVEITFNDGTTRKNYTRLVRGSARNPMNREEVEAKCRDLISGPLGADKAQKLIAAIFDLEKVSDIRTLRPLMQRS